MTQATVEIKLTSLAHDGRAVGRIDVDAKRKQVVFVQGGLPGQRVLVAINKSKKNFAEGICVKILEQAADFIAPPCEHAELCGGCALQSMPYEKQLFWKQSMLLEALSRIGKFKDIPFTKIYPSPELWHYRNKMEFAVGKNENSKLILGLRAKSSHEIIPTPKCLLMPTNWLPVFAKLAELMEKTGYDAWKESGQGLWRHVVIRKASGDCHCHIQIITDPSSAAQRLVIARLGQELLNANLGVLGFAHEERSSKSLYAQGELCITSLGQKYLQEELGGVNYSLDYGSFFQVNASAAQHLAEQAEHMAKLSGDEVLWDIYCGVGAPSLGFAKHAKALYGVESNAKAIKMARQNAKTLGFSHCHYEVGMAEKIMAQSKPCTKMPLKQPWPKPDVIVADPPRAGMHAKVVQAILLANPSRIVYISCNPATLSRDLSLLSSHYKLSALSAVDLFPHTAHVESCALLERIFTD